MKLGLSLALILTAGPCLAETAAGVAHLADTSNEDRPLALSIWYPSEEQPSASIGGNPVFQGVAAVPDAAVPQGPLPLVVVSHGGLRSAADSGAWLSSSVARAGFIVVEVNAPRPRNAASALDEIWRRPQDVSRAIDLMLADAAWGPRIDASRTAVVGFALGGTAALSLAGAELDPDRYMQSCAAGDAAAGPDCAWFAAQGVEMTQTSAEGLAGQIRDPRVTSVVVVNPEYPAALGAAPAEVATLLVSLGRGNLPAGTARTVAIQGASAFDAFAACTEAGPAILLEEDGDASLCGASADARHAMHQEISDAITSFLSGDRE